jgi:hypothetical protein
MTISIIVVRTPPWFYVFAMRWIRQKRSKKGRNTMILQKTNMTTMGPGLRRSVSDGDLTLDEVILRPRKKRSHLFVQSTLDEANNKEHSPLTAVKSQTSQLLPRDLLPVVSEGMGASM